ncbi:hypothetical protein [Bartonella vinsonii]|uniref:hypothetical protein n=1 Tax=Bartonella vinsonii TaxID=33047 RepID=UPI00047C3536|nr:hypothetical protein [Bartonella vinsonii]
MEAYKYRPESAYTRPNCEKADVTVFQNIPCIPGWTDAITLFNKESKDATYSLRNIFFAETIGTRTTDVSF